MSRKHEIIGGRKFEYKCKCKPHSLNCVAEEMWDAAIKTIKEGIKNAR